MGEVGSKLTPGAGERVEAFVDRLRPLGDINRFP
jgi:hypothetical protein